MTYWLLIPAVVALTAVLIARRLRARPRRRRTPHTYIPPCIEK